MTTEAAPPPPPEGGSPEPSEADPRHAGFLRRIIASSPAAYDHDIVDYFAVADTREFEGFSFQLRAIRGVVVRDWRDAVKKRARKLAGERLHGDDGDGEPDFFVEKITRTSSIPRIYTFHIEGRKLSMGSAILMKKSAFKQHLLEHLNRIPYLPKGWDALVNSWLARAEEVESAPEASEDVTVKRDIVDHIDAIGVSDIRADIMHGKAFLSEDDDKRRAFRTKPLLAALRADGHQKLESGKLCDLLRDLGCVSRVRRVEGISTRLWLAPEAWPDLLGEEGAEELPRQPGEDDE